MIYCGIDLHATNMVIVAITGNGDEVRQAKLPSNGRALEGFFGTFDEPVQAVVECSPLAEDKLRQLSDGRLRQAKRRSPKLVTSK